ncbi:hypothetical protein EBF03_07685 [Arcanobacterium haemolyticum]|uniref:hypothetical protein n=1 Tax=Arcanobacterium haemolyticum TaxID=28264 RepID=UPI001110A014|nr:hypothetical protein [Arcanobacterium haemolyticum]QCX47294.1 hypothetical protein EBF03_07685 [Arcanobacterium haemolyticum]
MEVGRQRAAEGVLALCLGAGCSGATASYLRAEDVTRDDNGTVWVKRYDMVHAVPVSVVFAGVVEELAARKDPHEYVLGRGENPCGTRGSTSGGTSMCFPAGFARRGPLRCALRCEEK